jgi:hypothetical protein
MTARTKAAFFARCEALGIEVSHEQGRGAHHVHLQAPSGKRFAPFELDTLAVWDGAAPCWEAVHRELDNALPLEDDPDPD